MFKDLFSSLIIWIEFKHKLHYAFELKLIKRWQKSVDIKFWHIIKANYSKGS